MSVSLRLQTLSRQLDLTPTERLDVLFLSHSFPYKRGWDPVCVNSYRKLNRKCHVMVKCLPLRLRVFPIPSVCRSCIGSNLNLEWDTHTHVHTHGRCHTWAYTYTHKKGVFRYDSSEKGHGRWQTFIVSTKTVEPCRVTELRCPVDRNWRGSYPYRVTMVSNPRFSHDRTTYPFTSLLLHWYSPLTI